ncbi:thioesterase [Herbaspirillum sp. meg3]|nr:thioesterase [Herbaspirillum sp. meg3]
MLTLFCLPCAGASAAMYQPWRAALPASVRMQPLELPGRGRRMREPQHEDFGCLADLLTRELAAQVRGAYAIFGHSMGGLLAHGIVQRLCAQRPTFPLPVALLISACAAPSVRQWSRPDESDAALIASLRRQGGTPSEVFSSPELLEMILPVLRADYRVCRSFRCDDPSPVDVPIHVFGGLDDAIPAASLQGWRGESSAEVTLDWFEGGHFYLQAQQAALMATIATYLNRYPGRYSSDEQGRVLPESSVDEATVLS